MEPAISYKRHNLMSELTSDIYLNLNLFIQVNIRCQFADADKELNNRSYNLRRSFQELRKLSAHWRRAHGG